MSDRLLDYGNASLKIKPLAESQTDLSRDIYWFWQMHPRISFIKSLGRDSRVLDFGAGNGDFFSCKDNYMPHRPDQKFYAFDMFKGRHFDQYDDHQVADFEKTALKWENESLDAVFAAHVLEHLNDLRRYFAECWRVLRPGGKVYVETPAPYTASFPYCGDVSKQGFPVIASNFFEDETHIRPISIDLIKASAELHDFRCLSEGYIHSDYFGDALLLHGSNVNDTMYGMFGLWTKTAWAQYLTFQKPDSMVNYIRSCNTNVARADG